MVRPWTSTAMFALIAVLMAVDTVIDYRLSGSFGRADVRDTRLRRRPWRDRDPRLAAGVGPVAKSEALGRELTATRADAQRFSREAQDVLKGLGVAIDRPVRQVGALAGRNATSRSSSSKACGTRKLPSFETPANGPSGSRPWRSTGKQACQAAPTSPRSSSRISCSRAYVIRRIPLRLMLDDRRH